MEDPDATVDAETLTTEVEAEMSPGVTVKALPLVEIGVPPIVALMFVEDPETTPVIVAV